MNDFDAIFRTTGSDVKFGLYSSTGIDNPPVQLLATTGSHAITSTGLVSIPSTQTTTVPAGYYWIVAVYDANTSVGATGSASGTMAGTTIDYRSFTYSDTLPQTFGTAAPTPGSTAITRPPRTPCCPSRPPGRAARCCSARPS